MREKEIYSNRPVYFHLIFGIKKAHQNKLMSFWVRRSG